jgi:hypothetical protein
LGSDNPLIDAKLLEFSHDQGVRQIFMILHCTPEKGKSGGYGLPECPGACAMGRSDRVALPEMAIFSDVKSIIALERS